MKMIRTVPTFGLILLAYNLVCLAQFAVTGIPGANCIQKVLLSLSLPSGVRIELTAGDAFLIMALFCLYIEIFKSTDASDTAIIEHILSFFVFLTYLGEFMFVEIAANATFMFLGLMSMLDLLAGFTISISAARRDFAIRR